MSVLVLATAVCLDCGLTSAALAADMPVKARAYAPLAPPAYDWSGLYVGANVSGGWSNRSLDIAGMAWHDLFSTEFIGGLQLGYNLHAGHFLLGVEGDLDWSGFTHPNLPIPTPAGPVLFSAKQDWISTVAARFGFTFDRWLAYGKVGGGWARDGAALNLPNGTARRFRDDTRQRAPSDLRLAFTTNLRQHLVSVYGVLPAHGRPGDTCVDRSCR